MMDDEIRDALERLGYDMKDAHVTQSLQGSGNRTMRLLLSGDDLVLRIAGKETVGLVDRTIECDHMLKAAALGIGPEVVAVDPSGRCRPHPFRQGSRTRHPRAALRTGCPHPAWPRPGPPQDCPTISKD